MSWTDERVALLRQLWGSGKSASEIADLLGGVSRNAVIGKAHRLELSGRPSPIKRREDEDAPEAGQPAATAVAEPPAPVRVVAVTPPARTGGATILSLTDRMCKWPIGDPKDKDFHFCGRATHAHFPYCAEHAALAYQPPGKRRDEDGSVLRA
jgi:GcrA cell cycle regulator